MKLASLRVRVTSWYCGLLAITLVIFGAAVWLGLRNYLITTVEQTLRDESNNMIDQFVAHVDEKGAKWLAGEIQESYAPEGAGRYIRIFREGKVLYQSGNMQAEGIDPSDSAPPDLLHRKASYQRIETASAGPILFFTNPWASPSGIHFIVQAGAPTQQVDRILRSLLIALSILTPLILAGAAIGGYLLMNVPFRPVVALTRQAEQIGTHALGERLPVIPTGDELERLSISLNRMIDRLEDALAHNQRFSADVSHELRTPLTILRGELEPLVDNQELSPLALDAIGSALEEIDRMSDIVENLLVISKLDFRNPLPRTPVNLNALALSTVEQLQLLAEDKQLAIHASVAGETWVPGDRVRLQQVIVNLLDNAIKYTSAGGDIWLAVSTQHSDGVIEIRDNGIGIPAECLPFVFDRFYRADKARSRESGGTGLGLSIVKAICAAFDGTVSIQSREGVGTVVQAAFPLCTSAEVAESKQSSQKAALKHLAVPGDGETDAHDIGSESVSTPVEFSHERVRSSTPGLHGAGSHYQKSFLASLQGLL
jgi:signal transduction histidine kinase